MMSEELERLKIALAQAQELNRVKDQQITKLNSKVQEVQNKLEILQRHRPKLPPDALITSFRQALEKMQTGLESGDGRVNYIVNNLDIELKAAVTLDDEGEINFQLPKVDDIIPLENLSRLKMSILPVPKPTALPSEVREVPGVIGLSKEKAVAVLTTAGFTPGEVTEGMSSSPPGMVIAQDPERYSHTTAGSGVDLVISKQRETEVPNLIGMTRDDALESLTANRLRLGQISEQVSVSPSGTVIQQSIQPGIVVAVDTEVDLGLAKSEMVKTPDVVGKMLPTARRLLTMSKLKSGKISEVANPEPKGTILEQKPVAGSEISAGSSVDLVVAAVFFVTVPNLGGMTRPEAEKVLNEINLAVGRVQRRRSPKPVGTIIGQKPIPGEKIKPGTLVNLTVAYPGL